MSSDYILDNVGAELETQIVASIHTLKRGNKKCGTGELYIDNKINRKEKILETLIQIVMEIELAYGYLKRIKQVKQKLAMKNNLKEDFLNFKGNLIDEFQAMKCFFFVEVKQVKN